jgi:hypothetical protein
MEPKEKNEKNRANRELQISKPQHICRVYNMPLEKTKSLLELDFEEEGRNSVE